MRVGHALNLDHLSSNRFDIMYDSALYRIDRRLPTGAEIILRARSFSLDHIRDWAATGRESGGLFRYLHPPISEIEVINIPGSNPSPPENPNTPNNPSTPNNPNDPGNPNNPGDSPGTPNNPNDPNNPNPPNNPNDPGSNPPVQTPNPPVQQPPAQPASIPPTVPLNLLATHGDTNVALSWQSPQNSGSSPISDYEYNYREGDSGSWTGWTAIGSASTSVYVNNLTNGTTYGFMVKAKTNDGYSPSTSVITSTPSTIPSAPSGLSASGNSRNVYLSWTAPYDGGTSITDYQISYARSGSSFGSWSNAGDTNTGETVYNLTNGVQYKFKVRAVNINGVSSESSTAYATPVGFPSEPTNFTATAGDGEVWLSWSSPNNNGGSSIQGYEYGYRQGSSGHFSAYTYVGPVYAAVVTNLTNGTEYEFRVRAVNSSGGGTRAGPISATPEASVSTPDAPTGLSASGGSGGLVVLGWNTPSSDGGAAITDYEYIYRQQGGSWSSWSSTEYFPLRIALVYGLTSGVTYEFRVRAVNSEGGGSESNTASGAPTTSQTTPSRLSTLI